MSEDEQLHDTISALFGAPSEAGLLTPPEAVSRACLYYMVAAAGSLLYGRSRSRSLEP